MKPKPRKKCLICNGTKTNVWGEYCSCGSAKLPKDLVKVKSVCPDDGQQVCPECLAHYKTVTEFCKHIERADKYEALWNNLKKWAIGTYFKTALIDKMNRLENN